MNARVRGKIEMATVTLYPNWGGKPDQVKLVTMTCFCRLMLRPNLRIDQIRRDLIHDAGDPTEGKMSALQIHHRFPRPGPELRVLELLRWNETVEQRQFLMELANVGAVHPDRENPRDNLHSPEKCKKRTPFGP